MSNEFAIGKELGELRARVERIESELRHMSEGHKCKCVSKSSEIMPALRIHPDDIKMLDEMGAPCYEAGDTAEKLDLADRCFSVGTTRCYGGYCQGCCGGEWVYLKDGNNRRVSCPVPMTSTWNCGGQRYRIGNCQS